MQKETDDGRATLPSYNVTDIIFSHMIKNKLNLSLIIRKKFTYKDKFFVFSFQGSPEKNDFVPLNRSREMSRPNNLGYLVVTGEFSDESFNTNPGAYLKKLLLIGIKNIILMNAAAHPQYAGEKLRELSNDPFTYLLNSNNNHLKGTDKQKLIDLLKEFEEMKCSATKIGCSVVNQTTFLAKHIFSDTLKPYSSFCKNKQFLAQLAGDCLQYYGGGMVNQNELLNIR